MLLVSLFRMGRQVLYSPYYGTDERKKDFRNSSCNLKKPEMDLVLPRTVICKTMGGKVIHSFSCFPLNFCCNFRREGLFKAVDPIPMPAQVVGRNSSTRYTDRDASPKIIGQNSKPIAYLFYTTYSHCPLHRCSIKKAECRKRNC